MFHGDGYVGAAGKLFIKGVKLAFVLNVGVIQILCNGAQPSGAECRIAKPCEIYVSTVEGLGGELFCQAFIPPERKKKSVYVGIVVAVYLFEVHLPHPFLYIRLPWG